MYGNDAGGAGVASGLFPFFDRPGPVLPQQPRERAVREHLAAGLARRAVVRLVLGVHDPPDLRAAHGARLAEASVDSEIGPERRDIPLPGEPARAGLVELELLLQAGGPFQKRVARCRAEPGRLLALQRAGEGHRAQP